MTLEVLKSFNFADSTVAVWIFKRSGTGEEMKFTGRWLEVSESLSSQLIGAAVAEAAKATEVIEYSLLAQNNEASLLTLDVLETNAGMIRDAVAAEVPAKKISKLKDVSNAFFYVLKFASDGDVVLAVRKTDASWSTKKAVGVIPTLFSADDILDVDESPKFNMSRKIDFFVVGESILVGDKANFESVLAYKAAHIEKFSDLCADAEFLDVFSDIAEIKKYVGNNKIQLRRALAIQEKGHYKDAGFMASLRGTYAQFGLNISFDSAGKIVPCEATCRDIFQALLDHRLKSHHTNIYDVQAANVVPN